MGKMRCCLPVGMGEMRCRWPVGMGAMHCHLPVGMGAMHCWYGRNALLFACWYGQNALSFPCWYGHNALLFACWYGHNALLVWAQCTVGMGTMHCCFPVFIADCRMLPVFTWRRENGLKPWRCARGRWSMWVVQKMDIEISM